MRICIVRNCGEKHRGLGYCIRHFYQFGKYGKPLKRTKFDKNEFFDRGDYYEMALYSGHSEQKIVGYTKFSKRDLDKIKPYKWNFARQGYVGSQGLSLHRYLMNCPKNLQIDHVNGDKLDNRQENLRLCNKQENARNNHGYKFKTKVKSSKYLGVSWHKRDKLWRALIKVNSKQILIGSFKNERHAAMARDIWAKELFGEFVQTNF